MMKTGSNDHLISEFKKGTPAALSQVYDLYYAPLCYFAIKLIGEQTTAEEIAAESLVKLWKLRENFETEPNIKAFLYITTRNACFNYLKFSKREQARQQDINYHQPVMEEKNMLQDLVRAEVLQEVYIEIEKLPKKCRQIVMMVYIEGLTSREIAGRLGISIFTVRSQRARALQLLRSALLKKNMSLGIVLLALGALPAEV